MKMALIGLPLSGKSTIFDAASGAHEPARSHAPGSIPASTVPVPDERMDFLRDLVQPKKFTLATVEYLDVASLFGGQPVAKTDSHALAAVREADGLVKILRAFESDSVPHPKDSVDPARDLREMDDELLLLDLDQVERRIEKLEQSLKRPLKPDEREKKELAALQRCKRTLEGGGTVADVQFSPEEALLLRGFCFLTQKPVLVVLNVGEEDVDGAQALAALPGAAPRVLPMCGELEKEIAELEPQDRPAFLNEMGITEPGGPRLIRASFQALAAVSFFTTAHDELRAWTVRQGDSAVTAASKIHTDMARGFIRAEVTAFDDLKALGSFKEARAKGKTRLESKEYIVQDGDIMTFRFAT